MIDQKCQVANIHSTVKVEVAFGIARQRREVDELIVDQVGQVANVGSPGSQVYVARNADAARFASFDGQVAVADVIVVGAAVIHPDPHPYLI